MWSVQSGETDRYVLAVLLMVDLILLDLMATATMETVEAITSRICINEDLIAVLATCVTASLSDNTWVKGVAILFTT